MCSIVCRYESSCQNKLQNSARQRNEKKMRISTLCRKDSVKVLQTVEVKLQIQNLYNKRLKEQTDQPPSV